MKGCERFALPPGGTDGADAGRDAFHQGRLSVLLGARAAQVRLATGCRSSPVRSAAMSNTTPTWTSTMTNGPRAKRRGAPRPRRRPFEFRERWAPGGPPPRSERRGPLNGASLIGRMDDLRDGEARALGHWTNSRAKAFVVRRAGRLYAWWDACPHYGGTPMAWRTNAYLNPAGDRIVCASTAPSSRSRPGAAFHGAALGQSLEPAPIEVTGDGAIVLEVLTRSGGTHVRLRG